MAAPGIKAAQLWRSVARPLLEASPRDRLKWLCLTVFFGLLAVGLEVGFYNHYRIAWDRQVLKCLDYHFLLVDLKNQKIVRGGIYTYRSAQAAPVIKDGTLVAKYVRGVPGDVIEIRSTGPNFVMAEVYINGELVATGMPHLRGMTKKQASKFFGVRALAEDEFWMMGTKPLSFDSRYWGPIHRSQIVARAYGLF